MEALFFSPFIILTIACVLGFFAAWGIGANDVANAMGTSVGSKALTLKQAVIIAAIFEFLGAFLAGGEVTSTIRKGIVDPLLYQDDVNIFIVGMMATLLATGSWLMLASRNGWPVSTTHSIVGAIVGFVLITKGSGAVSWDKIFEIALTPNRCDAISHYGVARDLSAALSYRNDKKYELILPSVLNYSNLKLSPGVIVDIKDSSLCNRFCGLVIKGIKIKPSSEEIKNKLGLSDKYPRFSNFKTKVLEIAKTQINKHTDIKINYETDFKICLKESGSFIAISAKTFLFKLIIDFFNLPINSEYDIPPSLTAALILCIHSDLKSLFLFLRSLYAYCIAFSIACFATLIVFFLLPH